MFYAMDDGIWLAAAERARQDSHDPDCQVGCVLVAADGRSVVSANRLADGVRADVPSRLARPAKYDWIQHAETTGVFRAAREGMPLEGARAYCTRHPCHGCASALAAAGVAVLVCPDPEFDHPTWGASMRRSQETLREAGVRFVSTGPRRLATEGALAAVA